MDLVEMEYNNHKYVLSSVQSHADVNGAGQLPGSMQYCSGMFLLPQTGTL